MINHCRSGEDKKCCQEKIKSLRRKTTVFGELTLCLSGFLNTYSVSTNTVACMAMNDMQLSVGLKINRCGDKHKNKTIIRTYLTYIAKLRIMMKNFMHSSKTHSAPIIISHCRTSREDPQRSRWQRAGSAVVSLSCSLYLKIQIELTLPHKKSCCFIICIS